jgi:hypothetical protein
MANPRRKEVPTFSTSYRPGCAFTRQEKNGQTLDRGVGILTPA